MDEQRILVPISCSRCHDPYSYSMLPKYATKRQECIYGDVCNGCLTTEEKADLILRLECEEGDLGLVKNKLTTKHK